MNKLMIVSAIALASLRLAAADVLQYVGACDWATFTPDPGTTHILPNANSTTEAYTLSANAELAPAFRPYGGYVSVFDFRNGNHILKSGGVNFKDNNTTLHLLGGTWDLSNASFYHGGKWWGTSVSGQKFFADGTRLTNVGSYFRVCSAKKGVASLNATQVAVVNGYVLMAEGEGNVVGLTNSVISIDGKGHSKIASGSGIGGNVVQFDKSALFQTQSTDYTTGFCGESPDNVVRFSNGSAITVSNGHMFEGASADRNVVALEDSAFTNLANFVAADAVGAESNVLSFTRSRFRTNSQFYTFEFSPKGSFNTLAFSNSAVDNVRWVRVGRDADATGNVALFSGAGCSLSIPAHYQFCFGAGTDNSFILDGCSFSDSNLYFCLSDTDQDNNKSSGYENASTNNTLRLVNGATLRPYCFYCNYACKGNEVDVGEGCVFGANLYMWFRGVDNKLVVSNGTVRISQAGKGLMFGSPGDVPTGQPFVESGNALIVRGTCPKFVKASETGGAIVMFHDDSRLVFDIPQTGYDAGHVVFDNVGAEISYPSTIQFLGVEEYSKTLERSVNIQLSTAAFTVSNVPEGTDFWAEVNADMPKGSYAYLDKTNRLWLHVKRAPKGMVLIVR